MEDTDNIHDDTTEKANVAAGKLITIEERAEKAYNEFQTATTRAKIAEERATAKFKCKPGATDCCCRRILYNEPDFVNVPSLLEIECNSRGFQVLFLPKFHCELNFIEQCWGFAKRTYRKYPESSKEADLEKNVIDALASVPIESMRRCIKSKSHEFLLTDGFIPGLQCALFDSWMDIGKD